MSDAEYFARRAEQEAAQARKAKSPAAVAAHSQMSTAYRARAQPPKADAKGKAAD